MDNRSRRALHQAPRAVVDWIFCVAVMGINERPIEEAHQPIVWQTVFDLLFERKVEPNLHSAWTQPFLEIPKW